MAAKSGSGAAVSSGADFQARVAAHLIAMALTGFEDGPLGDMQISHVGFETAEAVDDINFHAADGRIVYVQAKSELSYSVKPGGELRSVLAQFERQHSNNPSSPDLLMLICGSSSSKTVSVMLKATIEAFRTSPMGPFRRDQPVRVVQIFDELVAVLCDLQVESGRPPNKEIAYSILRKARVVSVDVHSSMHMVSCALLQKTGYIQPDLILAKLISDCIGYAKRRHTVEIALIKNELARYLAADEKPVGAAPQPALVIDFSNFEANVGREVILARFPERSEFEGALDGVKAGQLAILEMYRFDEGCRPRCYFEGNACRLLSGIEVEVVGRAATVTGLVKLIEEMHIGSDGEEIAFIGLNSEQDFELGTCAELHRKAVQQALNANPDPLKCIECGEAVFSGSARVVEHVEGEKVIAGLAHLTCVRPIHRVLARVTNENFSRFPELVNFDVNAWAFARMKGPVGLAFADTLATQDKIVAWSGSRADRVGGNYVVEIELERGGSVFATKRGRLHRFTKHEASKFADQLALNSRTSSDPLSYSSETWKLGNWKALNQMLGGRERIEKIVGARAVPYNRAIESAYASDESWYTPVCYLRDLDSGDPINFMGALPLILDPLNLKHFRENWHAAGFDVVNYEVATLLTDDEFDAFLRWVFSTELQPVIDPLLAPGDPPTPIGGTPIVITPAQEDDNV